MGIAVLITAAVQLPRFFVSATGGGGGASASERPNIYLQIYRGEFHGLDEREQNIIGALFYDSIDKIIQVYHKRINDLFNERIRPFVTERDFKKVMPLLIVPDNLDDLAVTRQQCRGTARRKNLSTFCISLLATDEFFDFREALLAARLDLADRQAERIAADRPIFESWGIMSKTSRPLAGTVGAAVGIVSSPATVLGGTVQTIANAIKPPKTPELLDKEIEISKQALDQTLAFYNELQIALPLHRKYREIQAALIDYNNKLSRLRQKIEQFPKSFYNFSTTKCT